MPQIGPLEIATVALIALLVFGPQKLPQLARSAARTLQGVRQAAADVKREVRAGMKEDESTAAPPTSDAAPTPSEETA